MMLPSIIKTLHKKACTLTKGKEYAHRNAPNKAMRSAYLKKSGGLAGGISRYNWYHVDEDNEESENLYTEGTKN